MENNHLGFHDQKRNPLSPWEFTEAQLTVPRLSVQSPGFSSQAHSPRDSTEHL